MFSLFRRSRAKPDPAAEAGETEETRLFHHSRVPDAEDLSAYITLGDEGAALPVELLDMNIQGAGLRMPFHVAPSEGYEQLVELTVSHVHDGWRVSSPARVTRVKKHDDAHVHVGLQFVNLGDLYAQLDDALGRYFNRRSTLRVQPIDGQGVNVRISYKHHRLRGTAHDLSRTGLGVRLTLVQAATFGTGELVTLVFDIPGFKAPIETLANVRHGYRLQEDVVLGMEYASTKTCSLTAQRKAYNAFLDRREGEMNALQEKLYRTA